MSDKDKIKDLFSEKLRNYEAKVKPELWNNIASQIGGVSATSGMSLVTKWIIGISISAATVVTGIVVFNLSQEEKVITPNQQHQINPSVEEKQATLIENKVEEQSDVQLKEENNVVISLKDEEIEQRQTVNNQGENRVIINEENQEQEYTAKTKSEEEITEVIMQNKDERTNSEEHNTTNKVVNKENNNISNNVADIPEPFGPEEVNESEVQYTIGSLPNVITPNGDRENDILHIESTNLTGFNITILNEQNQVVFQSNNPDFKWDGTDQYGQPVPEGRYVYFIMANEFSKDKPKRYSSLTVIR